MTQSKVKISCHNISKTFIQKGTQRVPVLHDVSLEVMDQELLVVLGPGQCGKTTLLRIIAGLETPSTGKIIMDGKEISGPGPDRGLVFQSYMLFPWKTVKDNVLIGLQLAGIPAEKHEEIVAHNLNMVLLPASALRRHEAARRHCPRFCHQSESHAHG